MLNSVSTFNKFIFKHCFHQFLFSPKMRLSFILIFSALCVLQSNSNCTNFDESTIELYRDKICRLPRILGACKLKQKRFYFNRTSNECNQFFYAGCTSNRNNFKTKTACECACIQQFAPMETSTTFIDV